MTNLPLLTTKFYIPPVPEGIVARPRLLKRLNDGQQRTMTLVSAPAGFGKSTLLSEWIAQLEAPVAWLSLDTADNDPIRFLSYFVAALQTIAPPIKKALSTLQLPQHPPFEPVLTTLVNTLATYPESFVLLLDDYHVIQAQAVHDSVAFMLEYAPPQMHLVVASRADPPLPVARLRGRGQLNELRQADLRFTEAEAAAFLNEVMTLHLTADAVNALAHRTEGWIAGLRMTAVSLQGREDVDKFIETFTGSHRYILDYLMEEVLERQPEPLRTFLLHTAILDQLNGDLCDAVLAEGHKAHDDEARSLTEPSGQAILEQLERANLFIVPLDDERAWYRYHRLFADMLRKRLHTTAPDLAPLLHRRASAWYEQQGLTSQAIEHALAAEDMEHAASLVAQVAEATLMHSEVATLQRWLDALPDKLVRARPDLCAFHAWTLFMNGAPWYVVEARLVDAVPTTAPDAAASTNAPEDTRAPALQISKALPMQAFVAMFRGNLKRAQELARQALIHLPAEDVFWHNMAAWCLAMVSLSEEENEEAIQTLEDVAQASWEAGNVMVAVMTLSNLAELYVKLGQLRRADQIYHRALDLATDENGDYLPIASEALTGLGGLAREWNNLDAAEDYLTAGIALTSKRGKLSTFDVYLQLAFIQQARGDTKAARDSMKKIQALAIQFDFTETDDWLAALAQANVWLDQGDLDAVARWAERRGLGDNVDEVIADVPDNYATRHLRKYEHIALARLWMAQGRLDDALKLLKSAEAQMRARRRVSKVIETQILQALALHTRGNLDDALDTLASALTLAEPAGYVRTFINEGVPMGELLTYLQRQRPETTPAYVAQLLAACDTPSRDKVGPSTSSPKVPPLLEPLSERELEVLRLLPTGLSTTDMAERLFISVHTVRSHLKNIYSKLDVHSRYEAIARAEDVGLL